VAAGIGGRPFVVHFTCNARRLEQHLVRRQLLAEKPDETAAQQCLAALLGAHRRIAGQRLVSQAFCEEVIAMCLEKQSQRTGDPQGRRRIALGRNGIIGRADEVALFTHEQCHTLLHPPTQHVRMGRLGHPDDVGKVRITTTLFIA
jgi:hypothetical protein